MEDEEENNNGDPVLINFDDDVEVGQETGGDLQNPDNGTAQEQYDEVPVSTGASGPTGDEGETGATSRPLTADAEKKELEELLSEYDQLKIDEAQKPGNKYVEYKSIFEGVSSDINKKTLELLAAQHPDFLDVSDDGIVTNNNGEVVETKEDFIKATGFGTGDIIYDNASKQFKNEEYYHFKSTIEQADDAWKYLKSSYKTETGNLVSSLLYQGESETLDFGKFEEEMKVAVFNLLAGDKMMSLAAEGGADKDFSFDWKKLPLLGETMSLQEKELLIKEAKGLVLQNQMKIHVSAANNLKVLGDDFEIKKKNLENNKNAFDDLAQRNQQAINDLNKRHGTWGYDKQGNIRFISYGKSWSEEDKASLIEINTNAKQLSTDKIKLATEYGEVLSLQETYNDSAKDLNNTTEDLFNRFLFNGVDDFGPAFKQTRFENKFNDSLRASNPYMGPVKDVVSTFVDGYLRYEAAGAVVRSLFLNRPTLIAGAIAGVLDYTTDIFQTGKKYNRKKASAWSEGESAPFMSDMFNGLLSMADKGITPVSSDPSGLMTKVGYKSTSEGWLGQFWDETLGEGSNWSLYSGTKTVAELMGYVASLRRGIGNIDVKHLGRQRKLLGYTKSIDNKFGKTLMSSLSKGFVGTKRFTGIVEMVKVNQRITLLDNVADGKARGMEDFEAFAYGNFLSFATGISQSIMPDYMWFNTTGGRKIKDALVKKLISGQAIDKIATRNAVNTASKQFAKNFFKEQLEEQVDVGLGDVVKTMFIAGHSPDILKVGVQAELIRGTTLLAGGLGSVQAARTHKTVRSMTNRAYYDKGVNIITQAQNQVKALEGKITTLGKSAKDTKLKELLEQDVAALQQNIVDGKDRLRAINAAPKQVTDAQIDLLIQKNKLIDERSKLNKKDKALVAGDLELINNQIAELDTKIQEATSVKYSESVMKAMLKNAKRLAKGLDIPFISLDESNYDKAVEEEIRVRNEFNKKIDDEIAQIDGSTPEGKKKITQLEARKLIIPTFEDPGIISYDHVTKKHRIVINEIAAKESQNEGVALHELFHAVLFQTVKNSPGKVKGLSYMMKQELLKNPDKYSYVLNKFDKYSYTKDVDTMSFDELFTVFSEAIVQGNIKIESTIGSKISDFIRRSLREIGINFTVSGPDGMIKFIRDYNSEVMSGRKNFSRGMQKIMDSGLKINVSKEYIQQAEQLEKIMILAGKNREFAREMGLEREDGSLPTVTTIFGREGEVKSAKSIKTKATTTSVYDQKKLVSDLKLKDSTAKIVKENAKIRELILEEGIRGKKGKIVASEDLQDRLVENNLALAVSLGTFAAQNPNIMGLEVGKRVDADQFISGYYMELSKLAGTYDASVNEFGQYLNTILPLRYGDILAAEKAGAVEGSVGLDAAKEIESDIDENLTPDEVIVGPEVDTAERLNIKSETKPFVDNILKKVRKLESLRVKISKEFNENTAKEIATLESQGVNDLELSTITVKQAPNLLYEFTSKLFGIDQDKLNPRTQDEDGNWIPNPKWLANLRKDDKRGTNEVRAAQRAVVQNVQLILSTIFNEGHTKAHKSSGMPNSLLKFGYNKSSKRIKNSWPQYKKPNLSEKDFLEFVGVYKVKGKYEFKVDRNTGTKLLAIASMVDRNMSLQAINENLKETGDITAQVRVALEDGMSKSSKSIFYIDNLKYQPLIQEKLPSISLKIDVADISKGKLSMDAINKIIADEFIDTEMGRKNGMIFAKQLTGKAGIIAKYAERVDRAGPMEKDLDVFLSEQLEETALFKGLLEKLKINVKKNADLYTVKTMQNARSRVGQFVTDVLLDEYNNSKKDKAAKKRLYEQIFMLMQQHVTAAKAGDGSVWFTDGTNEVEDAYYPEDKVYTKDKGENKKGDKHPLAGKRIEKGGTLRYQLFGSEQGSSVDFAKFMNTFLEGTGIKIGLTSAENKAIKDEYKIKALAPQKSSSVINSLIKKTFSYIDRYNEAMLARELTKKQVLFYAENKMIPKNELAVHMMTFGSNMGTVSRRAAYVYGIQEGLLSNGISGSYVYSKLSEIGKKLEFEHGKPHLATIMDLLKIGLSKKSAENKNTAMDEVFVDYEVNIITKKMDATLTASGVKSSMYLNYVLGKAQGWAQRLYNELNFGHPDVGAILSLSGDGKTIGGAHSRITKSKILPKSAKSIRFDQKINKGIKAARSIKYTNNPKGITVLDFDDTLATSKSLVISTSPEGTVRKLTAEEFATEGADLLDQGWKHDFSEFSKVVDGKVASLFNKAMKLQSKFGPNNMFVLTARPADSAPAIFEFLKANGLNIPLKNITGLANSTPEAKALWMAEKVGEGYNDFYFADDALQNVQAVQNILDQFDVKSKVQQAKASRSIKYDQQFNEILEETTGVESEKRFSRAKAKMRGEDKGKYKIFIPPSADDFIGLLYSFLGKGKKGEADFKFFKEALIEPLNRAYIELNMARQSIANDYKKLTKAFPEIRKMLYDKLPGTEFTTGDAMRVYLWDKAGYNIPGLSTSDQNALVEKINEDADLKAFADTVGIISRVEEGYVRPNDDWQVEDIRVDLMNAMQNVHRKVFFQQFLENTGIMFSKENLNKIEAIYGSNFREALEDMLYRIENGTNRSFGSNRLVNRFMNFINGSIGTTMFFNSRSAVLQTLSTVNFINWKENNPLAAAKAFANQKQFWADFSMIFNSTFLKQRRAGLNIDVNASELTDFVTNSKQPVRSAINWLLQKGFLPTQMMDSFAISMGGATHYRNNVNRLLKDGMTLKEAEEQAFLDMQEIAEETQQSARPDKISQQQASVLGRLILAFQNTPMQYTRLIKKAILDLQAGRGDAKSHVSRIIYYGAIQNAIFYSLQTALFAMMFGDDDDEEFIDKKTERVVNGSIDSILRGMGVGGAVVSTVKNMIKTIIEQQDKPRNRRDEGAVLMEFLNLSPPIGIKARQIQSASKTLNWNEDKIENMPLYNLENPVWEAGFNYTQAFTNVPLARLHTKVNNLREATNNDNQAWQRIALFLGWSKWNLGIKDKKSKSNRKTKKKQRGAFGGLRTAG